VPHVVDDVGVWTVEVGHDRWFFVGKR
jgi:hypothetical protein